MEPRDLLTLIPVITVSMIALYYVIRRAVSDALKDDHLRRARLNVEWRQYRDAQRRAAQDAASNSTSGE